jgi:hypothetical protein
MRQMRVKVHNDTQHYKTQHKTLQNDLKHDHIQLNCDTFVL